MKSSDRNNIVIHSIPNPHRGNNNLGGGVSYYPESQIKVLVEVAKSKVEPKSGKYVQLSQVQCSSQYKDMRKPRYEFKKPHVQEDNIKKRKELEQWLDEEKNLRKKGIQRKKIPIKKPLDKKDNKEQQNESESKSEVSEQNEQNETGQVREQIQDEQNNESEQKMCEQEEQNDEEIDQNLIEEEEQNNDEIQQNSGMQELQNQDEADKDMSDQIHDDWQNNYENKDVMSQEYQSEDIDNSFDHQLQTEQNDYQEQKQLEISQKSHSQISVSSSLYRSHFADKMRELMPDDM